MTQISLFNDNDIETRQFMLLPKNIFGNDYAIKPFVPSSKKTSGKKRKFLKQLLPLEYYDNIFIGFSGGKDSIAAFLLMLDLGVPKEKITLLHHSIDGNENPKIKMDWPITEDYCRKFAEHFGVALRFSWRQDGFFGEIVRMGASMPISFEETGESREINTTYGANWEKSLKLKKEIKALIETGLDKKAEVKIAEIKKLGYRFKFPAKSASLSTRWCSSILKIEVCDRLLRYSAATKENCKVLFVDGIRREESSNRSKYNEMELHNCHAAKKKNRLVHHWRPVIDYQEVMVWDIIKRYDVKPHPCYFLGFNRCSCALCIFSLPKHFKAIKEILPEHFNNLITLEEELDFTIDNTKDLQSYIQDATSCMPENYDKSFVEIIRKGVLPLDYFCSNSNWKLPAGAFHGAEGGPC